MSKLNSGLIKQFALSVGFHSVGITKPHLLTEHLNRLQSWNSSGFNGQMDYLNKNFPVREDISLLFPDVKSVIVTLLHYDKPATFSVETPLGKLSKYAAGPDYHLIIKDRFALLLNLLKEKDPLADGRYFTDSAPIFEREYARLAGLGWVGKHTLLIEPKKGSFFFIGIFLLNSDLETDAPFEINHCGTCRACIDSCPTSAILENGHLDAVKCISYQSIEVKSPELSPEVNLDGWVWGCDVCQDVCPWNQRFSLVPQPDWFPPNQLLHSLSEKDLTALSENQFRKKFSRFAVSRRGRKGLLRNFWHNKLKTPNSKF
ncbi:MAG: tRNA epoxyqueuosine(34) reductase QueG [Bacteroidetes bacterium]|nr:tRNA epoxyqueuosine(34) reductase QueG [Bacteroidota bacterium]